MTQPAFHAEIVQLHAFFQSWLGGVLPATDEVYARVGLTMAPEFTLVTPAGELLTRELLLADLRTAHGSRPGWRIWTERVTRRVQEGDLTAATYEEWQRRGDGAVTGRLSTAIFRAQSGTPNGVAWVHVHETWLPEVVQQRGLQ